MPITYEITDRILTGQYTAVMRGEMPMQELSAWLPRTYQTVHSYLQRAGVTPAGPPFARFTFLDDAVAVEAGFPVPAEVPGDPPVEPSALPDGPAAVTTHIGRYEDLDQAYRATRDWIADHGCQPAGPHWEVYYSNPTVQPDPTTWRTDVVVPYRPA